MNITKTVTPQFFGQGNLGEHVVNGTGFDADSAATFAKDHGEAVATILNNQVHISLIGREFCKRVAALIPAKTEGEKANDYYARVKAAAVKVAPDVAKMPFDYMAIATAWALEERRTPQDKREVLANYVATCEAVSTKFDTASRAAKLKLLYQLKLAPIVESDVDGLTAENVLAAIAGKYKPATQVDLGEFGQD